MFTNYLPILPPGTVADYLAEGAANIVYHLDIRSASPQPTIIDEYGAGTPPPSEIEDQDDSIFENKLLRLRKDLPTTIPVTESQNHWLRLIKPLFHSNEIIFQEVIQIPNPEFIQALNKELQYQDRLHTKPNLRERQYRPRKRSGTYLAEDEYGLLIEDMTAAGSETLFQFKPKWLLQSPSAPAGSVRCRTCAKAARDNAHRNQIGETPQPSYCPLDLLSKNESDLHRVANILLGLDKSAATLQHLIHWLKTNTLLPRLRQLQENLDPAGVLASSDSPEENLLVAMTLRDCSVYIKFPQRFVENEGLEAKIGDLDLKSGRKVEYWKGWEEKLSKEGWYTGEEVERQEVSCALAGKKRV